MAVTLRANIVYNHIPAVIESLVPQGAKAAKTYADRAQALAKSFAPVLTGLLRESITVVQTGPMDYETFTEVEYARFVEWGALIYVWGGRHYIPPHPYMSPAAQGALAELPSIETNFGTAIESAAITGRIQR